MFEESVILGIIVSFIYYEIIGVFAGGIIVPGYLVYYASEPLRILLTIFIALITYLLVYFIISRYILVYGARRFFMMVMVSFVIGRGLDYAVGLINVNTVVAPVGFLISGIIANNFVKQGVITTLIHMATVFIIMQLILIAIGIS
ncbi:MAG: poly-gamma-glutamate biosynthesis protein PgsC/CapC [bacterium]